MQNRILHLVANVTYEIDEFLAFKPDFAGSGLPPLECFYVHA